MSQRLGEINSNSNVEIVVAEGFVEVTAKTTTSATLEDIASCTFNLVVPAGIPDTAKIVALLTVQCSTTGGAPATGEWAININSADGTAIQRYMSGTNDTGALAVQAQLGSLAAGTYTVKGRHRRVSGASTVNSDVAQLSAKAFVE